MARKYGVKRRARVAGCLAGSAAWAGLAGALPPLGLAPVATGFGSPVFVTAPPGDTGRLFVAEQGSSGTARIKILNLASGTVNATPYVTITGLATGGERGLLGLAFDPSYGTNGRFYVNVTATGGAYGNGITQIREYTVTGNPDVAGTGFTTLLSFDQPQTNHNGGWIGFSPRSGDDHNLYIATGDGGNSYDEGTGHIEPGGNAQNTTTLLGKMLRIHVDAGTYTIPSDNPFAASPDTTVKKEIFAYGLRNPYRSSFDAVTGDLFIGDVGQGTREEVDVQKASNAGGGENYEWRLREGFIQTPTSVGGARPPGGVDPILDYPRSGAAVSGRTVIGGYVYRGSKVPGLEGTYVFGDYLGTVGASSGQIFSASYDGTTAANLANLTSAIDPGHQLGLISSFGTDGSGELYVTDYTNGRIYRIALAGDANLDGRVSMDDYLRIDAGLRFGGSGWKNGDFNGDGVISSADYRIIDAAYATLGPGAVGWVAVPEPGTVGWLGVGLGVVWVRRRRRRRRGAAW